MTLKDLAFSCFVYGRLTDYDRAYEDFLQKTDGRLNLSLAEHRQALLIWLNKWGCRQFSRSCHDMASDSINAWNDGWGRRLPVQDADIWALKDDELENVERAYCDLRDRRASVKKRKPNPCEVTVGPTGASKILFALRPYCLPPWDQAIAERLRQQNGVGSYSQFVLHVRGTLDELGKLCRTEGFDLSGLPARIGRPRSTLVKLIDEHHWVTISRRCMPPDRKTLQQWMEWDTA